MFYRPVSRLDGFAQVRETNRFHSLGYLILKCDTTRTTASDHWPVTRSFAFALTFAAATTL
jgi:hypothetical protein